LKPALSAQEVVQLQEEAGRVRVEDSVARYILDLVLATRTSDLVQLGVSPRGSVALYEACQARALVEGRDFVTPDDVKRMAEPVLAHRLIVKARGNTPIASARERLRAIEDIIKRVPIPV
jgi:MoxR-like ATPase